MARKRKADEQQVESEAPKRSGRQATRRAQGKQPQDEKKQKQATDEQKRENLFTQYDVSKVYRLIEPGPVLLVTTGSLADGTHNVMTIGFHMMMQHESPALIGVCIGPWDASFALLQSHSECVLAIPDVQMAGTTVDIGNCSAGDDGVNKWAKFGLEALPAGNVKAPLVGGPNIIANVECVVEDTKMVKKYSMWVLRAVKAWLATDGGRERQMFHHRGDGTFVVDGEVFSLQERMIKWKDYQDRAFD